MSELYRSHMKKYPQFSHLPFWEFTTEACREIDEFREKWNKNTPEANDMRRAIMTRKMPPIVLEFDMDRPDFRVTMALKYPILLDRVNTGIPRDTAAIIIRPEDRWQIERYYKSEEEFMERASQLAATYYAIRDFHAERYVAVDRKNGGHRDPSLNPSSRSLIVVKWDAPTRVPFRHEASGTGSPRCEHYVRGFWRKKPTGGVTWVKSHKRGNPHIKRKTRVQVTA